MCSERCQTGCRGSWLVAGMLFDSSTSVFHIIETQKSKQCRFGHTPIGSVSWAYRSLRSDDCSARGVRKVTTRIAVIGPRKVKPLHSGSATCFASSAVMVFTRRSPPLEINPSYKLHSTDGLPTATQEDARLR